MSPVTVRRALLEDLDLVTPMFDAYRQFYRQASAPDRVRSFLADRLRNHDSVIFLATVDGSAVGFTQLYPIFSSVSIGRALVLNDLYVAPAGRRHGVGRSLIDCAVQFGQETNALYLELATELTNVSAQRLYERAGWTKDLEFFHYSIPVPR